MLLWCVSRAFYISIINMCAIKGMAIFSSDENIQLGINIIIIIII